MNIQHPKFFIDQEVYFQRLNGFSISKVEYIVFEKGKYEYHLYGWTHGFKEKELKAYYRNQEIVINEPA